MCLLFQHSFRKTWLKICLEIKIADFKNLWCQITRNQLPNENTCRITIRWKCHRKKKKSYLLISVSTQLICG